MRTRSVLQSVAVMLSNPLCYQDYLFEDASENPSATTNLNLRTTILQCDGLREIARKWKSELDELREYSDLESSHNEQYYKRDGAKLDPAPKQKVL